MASNDIQINVTANTKNAEQGLKRVETQSKQVGKSAGFAGGAIGKFGASMGAAAIAAMGAQFTFQKFMATSREIAQTQAAIGIAIGVFGAGVKKNFQELEPLFGNIAGQFAMIPRDASRAFAALARASQGTYISIVDLTSALALAITSNLDVAAAADVWG